MKLQKNILFIFLFLIPFFCFAQDAKIDSLKKVIAVSKDDTSKVNTLNELSKVIRTAKPLETIRYGKEAIELATKLNYKKGLAYAYK